MLSRYLTHFKFIPDDGKDQFHLEVERGTAQMKTRDLIKARGEILQICEYEELLDKP